MARDPAETTRVKGRREVENGRNGFLALELVLLLDAISVLECVASVLNFEARRLEKIDFEDDRKRESQNENAMVELLKLSYGDGRENCSSESEPV